MGNSQGGGMSYGNASRHNNGVSMSCGSRVAEAPDGLNVDGGGNGDWSSMGYSEGSSMGYSNGGSSITHSGKAALLAVDVGKSLSVGGKMSSLSSSDFGGVKGNSSSDGGDAMGYGNGGGMSHSDGSSRSSGSNGKVSSGHTEAKTISDIAGALDDAVAIDVGVSSSGDSVSGAHFLLLGVAVGVSVAVLAQSVLSVVLAGGTDGSEGGGMSYSEGGSVMNSHGGGMVNSHGGGVSYGYRGGMSYGYWGSVSYSDGSTDNNGISMDGSCGVAEALDGLNVDGCGNSDGSGVGNGNRSSMSYSDGGGVMNSHGGGSIAHGSGSNSVVDSNAALLAAIVAGNGISVGGEMGSLGGGDFGGVKGNSSSDGGDAMGYGNGGGMSHSDGGGMSHSDGSSRSSGSDGEVSSGHTEAKTISDVAGALDDAVAIDVGVSSAGDSVSGAHFLLLGVAVGVSVAVLAQSVLSVVLAGAVLAQSVLSVVLAGGGGGHSYGHGSHGVVDGDGGGMGYNQGGGGIRGGIRGGKVGGIGGGIRSSVVTQKATGLSCGKSQKGENHLWKKYKQ
ncbi:hypothetical protein C0J52_26954 [Blattella germanica]|nr:hypothetical protein C0J52_26954 [Blattella germanica]